MRRGIVTIFALLPSFPLLFGALATSGSFTNVTAAADGGKCAAGILQIMPAR